MVRQIKPMTAFFPEDFAEPLYICYVNSTGDWRVQDDLTQVNLRRAPVLQRSLGRQPQLIIREYL
jgi:hypothetical protein